MGKVNVYDEKGVVKELTITDGEEAVVLALQRLTVAIDKLGIKL